MKPASPVDSVARTPQTLWMSVLGRLPVLLLAVPLVVAACPDPEPAGDDDSADDDDSGAALDDDDAWDDDDATELPAVDDPAGLVNGYWLLDLAAAEYVEPPDMTFLLAASIGDLSLLFGVDAASDLDAGEVHILGALGDTATEPVQQDMCQASQPFTGGPDGVFGTADDVVGTFENPVVTLPSFRYDLVSNGAVVPLRDVRLRFGFTPDGLGIERGRLLATMDTRPLSLDILNSEDPYRACTMIFDASGRDCFECGDEAPGNFCIALEIGALSGVRQGDGLLHRPCEDIISDDLGGVACDGKSSRFSRKGEEGFPLCPAYTGPVE